MTCSWKEPLACLSPLLIAYVLALSASVWSVLAKKVWDDSQQHRAFSRRDLIRSEEMLRELWEACLSEGFFMGNVGFSIWALTIPLEGQSYRAEVQAGAILLLFLSCALFPFMRAWRGRSRLYATLILVALALYILLRQRLG